MIAGSQLSKHSEPRGKKGKQGGPILRPTFTLVLKGAELFCPFLLLATVNNMQK